MHTNSSAERTVGMVTQAYQGLLSLYPAGFRAEYAQEMRQVFQERCLEIYQRSGKEGITRWLLKIVAGEVISIYKEYLAMTTELFEHHRDARRAMALGTLFLAGTWITFFFIALPVARTVGLVPSILLVLVNALLVARSLVRSERIEYIAGMAAMANMVLIAALMAVQASLGFQPLAAIPVQILLIGLHGLFLWRLRGEDLTYNLQELEIGE